MSQRTAVRDVDSADAPEPAPKQRPHSLRTTVSAVLRIPGLVIVRLLLLLLWLYQNLVSPMRGPTCRYYPSCSSYAVGALRRHGAAKGTALAVARVCRCHPWTAGGLDPVPPVGRWRNPPEPVSADPTDPSSGTASPEPRPDPEPAS
ncbi:MAG TPA: membrane protein insertion efficiency factor YidD [Candidatus Nanopelagicales bacterium]